MGLLAPLVSPLIVNKLGVLNVHKKISFSQEFFLFNAMLYDPCNTALTANYPHIVFSVEIDIEHYSVLFIDFSSTIFI